MIELLWLTFERIVSVLTIETIIKWFLVAAIPFLVIVAIERRKAIVDYILLLSSFLIAVSVIGMFYFKWEIMIVATIAIYLALKKIFKNRLDEYFELDDSDIHILGIPINRRTVILLMVTTVIVACQYYCDFQSASDTRTFYLPFARITAEMNKYPIMQSEIDPPFFSYPPALVGALAFIYQMIPTTDLYIYNIIPTLFFTGFFYIVLIWAKKVKVRYEIMAILLLMSYYFVLIVSAVYQEVLLIFGSGIVFYSIYLSEKTKDTTKNKYILVLMTIGITVSVISKLSGLFLFAVGALYIVELFFRRRDILKDKSLWIIMILFSMIMSAPYWRNLVAYGNPVLPLMNSITMNPAIKQLNEERYFMVQQRAPVPMLSEVKYIFPFFMYLAVIPFYFLVRRKVDKINLRFYIYIVAWMLFWNKVVWEQSVRYHFIWMPLVFIYLSEVLQHFDMTFSGSIYLPFLRIKKKIFKKRIRIYLSTILLIGLFSAEIAVLSKADYGWGRYDRLSRWWGAEIGQGARIYSDDDPVLMWEQRAIRFSPKSYGYTEDFLEAVNTKDFYTYFCKLDIEYIVDYPWKDPWHYHVYEPLKNYPQYYQVIYQKDGITVWKVIREIHSEVEEEGTK